MFGTKTKPVTLFSSTDNGAPKLTATKGSLKTLLKACLVTGYGDKKPLDWEMPFEDTNSAVFRSKAIDSNQFFLKINNDVHEKYAHFEPYRQMTSLNEGTGYFGYGGKEQNKRYGYIDSNETANNRWWLVGHGKGFILLVSRWKNTCAMFFGDVPSVVTADTGNTVFWTNNYFNDYKYLAPASLQTGGAPSSNYPCFAKTWDGRDVRGVGLFSSFAQITTAITYPDKITGGLTASEIFLLEYNDATGTNLRAEQVGILRCMHNLDEFPDGTNMGILDGDDSQYLKFSFAEDYNTKDKQYLVNITRWRD